MKNKIRHYILVCFVIVIFCWKEIKAQKPSTESGKTGDVVTVKTGTTAQPWTSEPEATKTWISESVSLSGVTYEPGTSEPEAGSNMTVGPGTSKPEAESEATSEPGDSEPEVESEATAEPESSVPEAATEVTYVPGTSEPEAESKPTVESGTSKPEAESEATSEPGNTEPGVESEATAEPESSVPEAESMVTYGPGTSEPEAESKTTVEPGTSKPETESEATAEPGNSEPEVESEATAEPESSVPEAESAVTYEPGTSEPEAESKATVEPGTSKPEAESEATAEPGNSEPEVESETTAEPESSVPEAESAVTYEPGTSEPEAESSKAMVEPGTSKPEAESEATVEPGNSEPEVESEATAEPESSVPEAESEVTSKPEVEPNATAEPETSESEVVSEAATESDSSIPVAESKVTAEPGMSKPESEPEVTTEPESETISEVIAELVTSKPEAESEVTAEIGISEPESGDLGKAESEIINEPLAEAEVRPSAIEIIVPPFSLIVIVILGMISLYAVSHCHQYMAIFRKTQRHGEQLTNSRVKIFDLETNEQEDEFDNGKSFFSAFDEEVFDSLQSSSNRPFELIKICLPAVLSLALCPLTLYMYQPFTEFIWPKNEYAVPPDINDAIACFLAPAGLVYATSFGFAFQQALTKQHYILEKITNEISMIDQIATFCTKLSLTRPWLKQEIYKAIKAEAMFLIIQILDREPSSYKNKPTEDIKVKIWSVVDMLRDVNTDTKRTVDRVLCEKILSHIMKLNSICSDRMGVLHTRIHPVKWAFLETLGFFSFIGVLLLQAYSYRMELVMCIITVFSISMLCYVVSDLDSPFSGFFRVDISVLRDVICRLETMYRDACNEDKDVNVSSITMTTVVTATPKLQTFHENDEKPKSWGNCDKTESEFVWNQNGFTP